jgi:acetyl-CoA synthetase
LRPGLPRDRWGQLSGPAKARLGGQLVRRRDAELVADVARPTAVVSELGNSFRPGAVRFTRALPKARSAKIVRRAVRAAVMGDDPGDLSTLEDPAAIDAVRRAV